MKLYKKIYLIFFICISVGLNIKHIVYPYDYKTQADMLHAATQVSDMVDTKFDQICNRIIKHFKGDTNFVNAFIADKEAFLKYRKIQTTTVLPSHDIDPTFYGTNYGIYAHSYMDELTVEKIRQYKRTVQMYCLYNSHIYPDSVCSEESIAKLFK